MTRVLPLVSSSWSMRSIKLIKRARALVSPLTIILLVRSSATTRGADLPPAFPAAPWDLLILSIMRTISEAEANFNFTISTSSSPARSTRSIISTKRFTAAARPVNIITFDASCPTTLPAPAESLNWRKIGASSRTGTLYKGTTRVIISSPLNASPSTTGILEVLASLARTTLIIPLGISTTAKS